MLPALNDSQSFHQVITKLTPKHVNVALCQQDVLLWGYCLVRNCSAFFVHCPQVVENWPVQL